MLKFEYRSVAIPIKPRILDIRKVDDGIFRLTIQFIKDNGEIYVYGPCCGATEEMMPSQQVFAYFVRKIGDSYKVGTSPLFRP